MQSEGETTYQPSNLTTKGYLHLAAIALSLDI